VTPEAGTPVADPRWRKVAGLLGLGARGRLLLVGVERVREAAKRGKVLMAIVAPDVSRHSKEKILPLLQARQVEIVEGPSASALGAAVGRESTAVVGIVDRDLARGIRAAWTPAPAPAP
jgi:ribosomal protein L7Ae-like RNA K-turn-binding protein